jgi:hypothetical protein
MRQVPTIEHSQLEGISQVFKRLRPDRARGGGDAADQAVEAVAAPRSIPASRMRGESPDAMTAHSSTPGERPVDRLIDGIGNARGCPVGRPIQARV